MTQQVILSYSANGFDTAVDFYNGIINNYALAALNVCNDERVPEDVKQRVWIVLRLSTAMKDTLGMFLENGGAKY
ncbi:MAG: hypothetical protein KY428_04265 [Bacteroidetes bacterium]|nr:hypothetical protein [Bacteroidota bacterium]